MFERSLFMRPLLALAVAAAAVMSVPIAQAASDPPTTVAQPVLQSVSPDAEAPGQVLAVAITVAFVAGVAAFLVIWRRRSGVSESGRPARPGTVIEDQETAQGRYGGR